MYSRTWTDYETKSVAFGNLRKALYPTYLVRWLDDNLFYIYLPTADMNNPKLLLKIKVRASVSAAEAHSILHTEEDVPTLHVVGGNKAYEIVKLVEPLIKQH